MFNLMFKVELLSMFIYFNNDDRSNIYIYIDFRLYFLIKPQNHRRNIEKIVYSAVRISRLMYRKSIS